MYQNTISKKTAQHQAEELNDLLRQMTKAERSVLKS